MIRRSRRRCEPAPAIVRPRPPGTTQDMTCAADQPPGPATPDENPNRHLTRHPRHHPPGTGHASRARSHRRTYQRPQRVVAQAFRHRPGGDRPVICVSALVQPSPTQASANGTPNYALRGRPRRTAPSCARTADTACRGQRWRRRSVTTWRATSPHLVRQDASKAGPLPWYANARVEIRLLLRPRSLR